MVIDLALKSLSRVERRSWSMVTFAVRIMSKPSILPTDPWL
ncbi:hypothetical protein RTBOTA2_000872 [Rhodotorula toruloides]|nr:hypothetical protein RTBOTA2_000872 [Rhodotorula toruloides]